eukprot:692165-Hanusia_phi.AAC.4
MYCYARTTDENDRIVLYLQTIESWDQRANDRRQRARKIAKATLFQAKKKESGFEAMHQRVSLLREDESGDETAWAWSDNDNLPSSKTSITQADRNYYDGVRFVLQETEGWCEEMCENQVEKKSQTRNMKFVEYEIFTSTRALVRRPKEGKIDLEGRCACCSKGNAALLEYDAVFNANGPWTVLYFADSPERSALEVEKERDMIREEFRKGAADRKELDLRVLASKVSFEYCFHKDITELTTTLHQLQPVVLHLACHGSRAGSITIGGKEMTLNELVVSLSSIVKMCTNLRLVVLNFCWSGAVALELRADVDFVVGHEIAVKDADALAFSKKLYYWMGANASLQQAVILSRPACQQCHLLTRKEGSSGVVSWRTNREEEAEEDAAAESQLSPRGVIAQMSLQQDNVQTQLKGCRTITTLCKSEHDLVDMQGQEGGVAVVLNAMRRHVDSEGMQVEGCRALVALSHADDANVRKIVDGGGIDTIIEAMAKHDGSAGVQEQGCAALKRISCQDLECASRIMDSGGIETVIVGMRSNQESIGVQEQGYGVLGNLSEAVAMNNRERTYASAGPGDVKGETLEEGREQMSIEPESIEVSLQEVYNEKFMSFGVVRVVVDGMRNFRLFGSVAVHKEGCRVLSNLTSSGEQEYCEQIIESGGVEAVVSRMKKFDNSAEVQEHGCRMLENLCFQGQEYCKKIGRSGIDAVIVGMQKNPGYARVQERGSKTLGALFSGDRQSCERILERGGVGAIITAMNLHLEVVGVQVGGCKALAEIAGFKGAASAQSGQRRIADGGGIGAVIKAMKQHMESTAVQMLGCKALGNVCVQCVENINKVVEQGGLDTVIAGMEVHAEELQVQVEGFQTLGKCFTADREIGQIRWSNEVPKRSGEVIIAGMAMHKDSLQIHELGCQVLNDLFRNGVEPELADIASKGIDVAIIGIKQHIENVTAFKAGVNAMMWISNRSEDLCKRILDSGGIQLLVEGMNRHGYVDTRESAILLERLFRMGSPYRAAVWAADAHMASNMYCQTMCCGKTSEIDGKPPWLPMLVICTVLVVAMISISFLLVYRHGSNGPLKGGVNQTLNITASGSEGGIAQNRTAQGFANSTAAAEGTQMTATSIINGTAIGANHNGSLTANGTTSGSAEMTASAVSHTAAMAMALCFLSGYWLMDS